jgi:hypothetical protein
MFGLNLTPSERLSAWRDLRHRRHKSLDELVLEFANVKSVPRYLDYYTPSTWPSPFEIVSDGIFDVSGVAIIIAATACYKKLTNPAQLCFDVISNHVNGDVGLYFRDSNRYINFVSGQISSAEFVQENGTLFDQYILTYQQLMKQE